MTLRDPEVTLVADFLSAEECSGLIKLSKTRLVPSVVINRAGGAHKRSEERSSHSAYLLRGENTLVSSIEARIASVFSCCVAQGEPLHVLKYAPATEYRPHYDYFEPDFEGHKELLVNGGQRYATVIMYLNDVEKGGATYFPQLGLDIQPRQGCALFFRYADECGNLDTRSLHGGAAVTRGEKWIATKWLRMREYLPTGE